MQSLLLVRSLRHPEFRAHFAERCGRLPPDLVARLASLSRRPVWIQAVSVGEVLLARTLANDPAAILADEPTGNLDPETREQALNFLGDLCREGRTVIMVTHDPAAASRATRVIKLRDGAVVSDSAPRLCQVA